jgi:hypothetical protein
MKLLSAITIALISLLAASTAADAQRAWCERNCVTLCKKIYGASGAGPCIAQYQCSQYAGKKCASSSYVNARYIVWCGSHSCVGGSTR